jgi:hypothetical protein
MHNDANLHRRKLPEIEKRKHNSYPRIVRKEELAIETQLELCGMNIREIKMLTT